MSEYLVILHDAEPPTEQGRENLQQELVTKLGIGEDAVREMFSNLPVILKENVSREHAEDFLRVLEGMGANVEILASDNPNATGEFALGDTPLLQVTNMSLDELSLSDASLGGEESIDDLENILNAMLNEGQSEEIAPTQAEDPLAAPVGGLAFTLDAEPEAQSPALGLEVIPPVQEEEEAPAADLSFALSLDEADDSAPSESFEDLNAILDQELGLPMADATATDESGDDLQSMFAEALASVESHEQKAEPTEVVAAATPDDPSAELAGADLSGLSLDLDDALGTFIEESSAPAEENNTESAAVAPPPEPPPAEEDTGLGFSLSLEPEEVAESSFEDTLSAVGVATAEEEDPFGGLDLKQLDQIEETATPATVASTPEPQKAAKAKKAPARSEVDEAIQNAFANAGAPAPESAVAISATEHLGTESSTTSARAQKNRRPDLVKKVGVGVVFLMLLLIAAKPDLVFPKREQGLQVNAEQLQALLASQAARREEKTPVVVAPIIQRYASTVSTEDGERLTIEILTDGSKIHDFEFLFEGKQPLEVTPEELVEGIDRPWVRKVVAKNLSLAELVERTTSRSPTPQKILIAESPARAYVTDLKGSSRFAGTVRVELAIEGESLVGTWSVHSAATPAEKRSEQFYVQRVGLNAFELSLNGTAELTPLRLPKKDDADADSTAPEEK